MKLCVALHIATHGDAKVLEEDSDTLDGRERLTLAKRDGRPMLATHAEMRILGRPTRTMRRSCLRRSILAGANETLTLARMARSKGRDTRVARFHSLALFARPPRHHRSVPRLVDSHDYAHSAYPQ